MFYFCLHQVHLCSSVRDFISLTVKPLLSSQSVPNFTPIAVKREILSVQAEWGSPDQRTASELIYHIAKNNSRGREENYQEDTFSAPERRR